MQIQPLVRFVMLLHKRVVPDVLNVLSSSGPADLAPLNTTLDALPAQSNAVVLAVEELVAALYAPQKPDVLSTSLLALVASIRHVHESISTEILMASGEDLAKEMGGLSIDNTTNKAASTVRQPKPKDARKWFETCLAQIDKSAKAIDDMLSSEISNTT